MTRAISHAHAGHYSGEPFDRVTLAHDERHLRRKLLTLSRGSQILIDLPQAVALDDGDVLVLEDGRLVAIEAAKEKLYEVTARDRAHLLRLAWHLGNRHLPAQIEETRILIQQDRVIRDMLQGLGATIREITSAFSPERGAYHSHGEPGQHHHG